MNNGQFFDIGSSGKGLDNNEINAMQADAKLELADLKRQVVYLQVFARRPILTHFRYLLTMSTTYWKTNIISMKIYVNMRIGIALSMSDIIFKSQSKIECLWNYFASFCECHKCSTSALVSNIPWSDIYKFLEFCYFDYISLDVDLIVCRGLKRGPQDDLVDKVKVYMLCLSLIASFTSITISHLTLFICFDLNVHGFTQKVVLYLKLNKSFSNTGFGEISINTHCSNVKNIILSDFQSIDTSWIWI